MRLPPSTSLYLALLPALAGCAIKSTLHLVQAQSAVQRAEDRGAAEHARYEHTLATRYLEKAREAAQENHHRTAEDLARAAAGYADQAVIRMQEMGIGVEGEAAKEALPIEAITPAPGEEPPSAPAEEPEPTPAEEPEPTPAAEPEPTTPESPMPTPTTDPGGGSPW